MHYGDRFDSIFVKPVLEKMNAIMNVQALALDVLTWNWYFILTALLKYTMQRVLVFDTKRGAHQCRRRDGNKKVWAPEDMSGALSTRCQKQRKKCTTNALFRWLYESNPPRRDAITLELFIRSARNISKPVHFGQVRVDSAFSRSRNKNKKLFSAMTLDTLVACVQAN